jgi:hypothetical protein
VNLHEDEPTEPVRIREREQKGNKRNSPAQESSSTDMQEHLNGVLLADSSQLGDWGKLTIEGNSWTYMWPQKRGGRRV